MWAPAHPVDVHEGGSGAGRGRRTGSRPGRSRCGRRLGARSDGWRSSPADSLAPGARRLGRSDTRSGHRGRRGPAARCASSPPRGGMTTMTPRAVRGRAPCRAAGWRCAPAFWWRLRLSGLPRTRRRSPEGDRGRRGDALTGPKRKGAGRGAGTGRRKKLRRGVDNTGTIVHISYDNTSCRHVYRQRTQGDGPGGVTKSTRPAPRRRTQHGRQEPMDSTRRR